MSHFINSLGQRDKPFVRDDEYDVRTPRPDLFDKPYAPSFASETFRKVILESVLSDFLN